MATTHRYLDAGLALAALATLILLSACAHDQAGGAGNSGQSAGRMAPQPTNIANDAFIEQWAATYRFSLGRPTNIKPTPDGKAVLFLRSGPRSQVRDLYEFDTATGKERLLLTAETILHGSGEKLTAEELARRERMRLSARGIAGYELSDDGAQVLINLSGRLFVIERAGGGVKELASNAGFPIDARFSPDGKMVSCVREGEVYVFDIASGQERRLTSGAGGTITNGLAEFVAQEEMDRFQGYWWSPDSKSIAYQQNDTAGMEVMNIMDATHPEVAPNSWAYPRPGKKNASVKLGVIPASGGETVWVKWDPKRFEYLARVKWQENSPLTAVLLNREQTEEGVFSIDPTTGYMTELLLERDAAWVNIDPKMPHWFKDGSGFLWTTERNGAWQLEQRGRNGALIQCVTAPDSGFGAFIDLDEAKGLVVFTGSRDPTQSQLFRAPLAPGAGKTEPFTHNPGVHGATYSKDHSVFVHHESTLEGQDLDTVCRSDGTQIGRLVSKAEECPFKPNLELVKIGSDPEFNAAIIRPRNFDPRVKYPVINSVYGGPHEQTVRAQRSRYILNQWIADHGFIVVSIDGRGTPGRGRTWERAIKNNLIELPMKDQANAIKALARRYQEMDGSRVGIYGWSFGGYFSAMATLLRPDVFIAGVAGAPVTDWADYDTCYTERYMGLPDANAAGYRDASALTHADQLGVPLLVIHGTADDNVYFMHSLKFVDALFRAGKTCEFLPLPGFTHMVPDPLVMRRLYTRVAGYFMENLKPRWGGLSGAILGEIEKETTRDLKLALNPDIDGVNHTLNELHRAAAAADATTYWSLYTPNATFLGTDPGERWTLEQFHAYADPHFKGTTAWTYTPRDRHISFSPDMRTAWFDEALDNAKVGVCRGSGVLVKVGDDPGEWKIEQYNLSIPIPNDATPQAVEVIKEWNQKAGASK